MKRHFLTQVFKPTLAKISYFKKNNLTLKQTITLTVLLFSALFAGAQGNIEFIENKGQWDASVQYRGAVSNGDIFIRQGGGFTIVQHNPTDYSNVAKFLHGQNPDNTPVTANDRIVLRSHAWNVDFVGASPGSTIVADKMISTHNNYFIGNDQSKWVLRYFLLL